MKAYSLLPLFILTQIYAECSLDKCGPPPMMPNYLCSDGATVAGPGDCIQNATGQCYWEIITCPNTEGYLRTIEASFCMDECSQYHIETEIDPYFGSINVIPGNSNIDMDSYIDRFIGVNLGYQVSCAECSAFEIEQINLSNNCQYPVDCFQDPCLVENCLSYPNADCVPNYCGGCYADFYNVNGQLIANCEDTSSCPGENPAGCFQNGCSDGYECIDDWENNCESSNCSCDEIAGQWICTDDCNGGTCIEVDAWEGCGINASCDDCTDSGCFWQSAGEGICLEECMIADIDCYGSTPNWTAECPENDSCTDLSGLDFGDCDMVLGIGYVDGECSFVSGCGWVLEGVNYYDAFFESIEGCGEVCESQILTCDEINVEYENLHSGEYLTCEYDNDCFAVWGHCDVGLGGCHYSVNEDNYPGEAVNDLVNMWLNGGCMQWVCDCSSEPYSQCIDGTCTSAYCMSENPAGCYQTGCEEGFECVVNPNECVPSWCGCDGFYGNWYCTEDCGGGNCEETDVIGDLNGDGVINIMDIVLVIDAILHSEYDPMGDLNGDDQLNVMDIVLLVNLILG